MRICPGLGHVLSQLLFLPKACCVHLVSYGGELDTNTNYSDRYSNINIVKLQSLQDQNLILATRRLQLLFSKLLAMFILRWPGACDDSHLPSYTSFFRSDYRVTVAAVIPSKSRLSLQLHFSQTHGHTA